MPDRGRATRSIADAQEFQRTLYDRQIEDLGPEAYIEGAFGQRMTDERIALALKYVRPGARVLDIGSGDGSNARALAERGATVLGIDLSARAIELANKHNPHPNIEYRQAA